jgi:hypothetical protein
MAFAFRIEGGNGDRDTQPTPTGSGALLVIRGRSPQDTAPSTPCLSTRQPGIMTAAPHGLGATPPRLPGGLGQGLAGLKHGLAPSVAPV